MCALGVTVIRHADVSRGVRDRSGDWIRAVHHVIDNKNVNVSETV